MKRENFYSLFFLLLSTSMVFLFILPKRNSLSVLNLELSQKKLELKNFEKYYQEISETLEKLKGYQEEISKINLAIPDDPSIPSIFHFLQTSASQSGLRLADISGLSSSKLSDKSKLKSWTTTLKLEGDYQAFKNFLTTLEKSVRLIKVENISLSFEGEKPSFTIKISFFSY